ncbi:carotenoid ester lipase precursor [Amylostereum chailletii]|nr:carotenoid ester lipase precursor [Amylostereum chailletii]
MAQAAPSVTLDAGTLIGNASGAVNGFFGIPFAQPPVGDLRLQLPQRNTAYTGTVNASVFGASCIQGATSEPLPPNVDPVAVAYLVETADVLTPSSEDCLTINVVVPANATADSGLPVVWIYGGGFTAGGTSSTNGSVIVERSIELSEPVIFVVGALGFLGGQEVKDAGIGNLGLQDQRLALRWVQTYIGAFGGDPTKVMIWGQSAGAISVALQMLTNGGDTEGLFRAAFMQSGSPIPLGDIVGAQDTFDSVIAATNCTESSDKLQCLREVPTDTLQAALNAPGNVSAQQSAILFAPRADGIFLTDAFQRLVIQGSVANIPFVSGDVDDEGTLFSIGTANFTTDEEFRSYIGSNYFPFASNTSDFEKLLTLYPNDTTQGSPFNTGTANALNAEFKRFAAIQGDIVFQAPRRFFLQNISDERVVYSFLSKRFKTLPDWGSAHASDLANVFGPGDMTDYLVRFAATLDPNGDTGIEWPRYNTSSPLLLQFNDGAVPLNISTDDYRVDGMALITKILLENPLS